MLVVLACLLVVVGVKISEICHSDQMYCYKCISNEFGSAGAFKQYV
jgi:nucleoside permease NupC